MMYTPRSVPAPQLVWVHAAGSLPSEDDRGLTVEFIATDKACLYAARLISIRSPFDDTEDHNCILPLLFYGSQVFLPHPLSASTHHLHIDG